jgi:hypothetical protein
MSRILVIEDEAAIKKSSDKKFFLKKAMQVLKQKTVVSRIDKG